MNLDPDGQPSLERVIGVRALAANTINLTVGAGIFVLPAVVAARLGPSAIFAYLVCAFAIGLVLLCFAEAGSVAILLVYLATAAATIELRRRDVRATPAVFRLIGGPLIPLIAAAVIVWLLSQARREEWLSIAVLVAVAAVVYALRRTGRRLGRQPD